MSAVRATPGAARPDADCWPRPDGSLVDCRDKLRVLRDNQTEFEQVLRDCFDDAVLMGVDPEAMRALFHGVVDRLRDPRTTRPHAADPQVGDPDGA
ncbi:MAG: hypothetical protein HIU92_10595 [Proteobacteria bacterium]|nr:hypothetical protein [Pseudomonadota bacterium]